MRFTKHLTLAAKMAILATMMGCSGGGNSNSVDSTKYGRPDQEALPGTVTRMTAPKERTARLTAKLNEYRRQSFGDDQHAIVADDRLYTSAFRHAVYLNGVNSSEATMYYTGIEQTRIVPEVSVDISGNSRSWDVLLKEQWPPGTYSIGSGNSTSKAYFLYPALYTSTNLYRRVEAVMGGRQLLGDSPQNSLLYEGYVFDGAVRRNDSQPAAFVGFNRDNIAEQTDEVDNLWYSRWGRFGLMRASTHSWGYASAWDSDHYVPPYPILHGRFMGVANAVGTKPLKAGGQPSYWPNDGNNSVLPYGLDIDVSRSNNDFCGPPVHVCLPYYEPISIRPGSIQVKLTKVVPDTPVPAGRNLMVVFTNRSDHPIQGLKATDRDFEMSGAKLRVVNDATISLIVGRTAEISEVTFLEAVDLSSIRVGDILDIGGDDIFCLGLDQPGGTGRIYVVCDPPPGTPLPIPPGTIYVSTKQCPPEIWPIARRIISCPTPTTQWDSLSNLGGQRDVKGSLIAQNLTASRFDPFLSNGEIVLTTVSPLEANTTYRIQMKLVQIDRTYNLDWQFTTNGRIPPSVKPQPPPSGIGRPWTPPPAAQAEKPAAVGCITP